MSHLRFVIELPSSYGGIYRTGQTQSTTLFGRLPRTGSHVPGGGNAAAEVVPQRDDGCPHDEDVIAGDADAQRRGEEQEQLRREPGSVDPALRDEGSRAAQQREVEDPGRVPQVAMGDQLHDVAEWLTAEHLPPE